MSIHKKLFEAKKEIGKISKDITNPFYKSKYFDINALLEHVEPILQKHGLLLLQPINNNNVSTEIIEVELGEDPNDYMVSSSLPLPNITDPQKLGSAITYYRRYTLQSLLGLQAEDDDANATVNKPKDLPWLNENSKEWKSALSKKSTLESLRKYFKISQESAEKYNKELKK